MAKLVKQFRRDPATHYIAAAATSHLTNKDFRGEAEALLEYVRANVRYLQDPNEVELVQQPLKTLEFGVGDCDDMATLLATLLESIGHPARFAAVAMEEPGVFDHVLVQTRIGNQWVPLDATEDVPLGWEPPGIISYMIQFI